MSWHIALLRQACTADPTLHRQTLSIPCILLEYIPHRPESERGGRELGSERGRDGGRKGGQGEEGGREGKGRGKGGRSEGEVKGVWRKKERRREGGREGGREGDRQVLIYQQSTLSNHYSPFWGFKSVVHTIPVLHTTLTLPKILWQLS